jgi:hypothetical protein
MAAVAALPAAAAPPPGMVLSDVPPGPTLYVQNLNEKIKKGELKRALFALFSQFGKLLDVVVCRTDRLRGQAWVVFGDVAASTTGLHQLQGATLFDRPMVRRAAAPRSERQSPTSAAPHDLVRARLRPTAPLLRQGQVGRRGQARRVVPAAAAAPL